MPPPLSSVQALLRIMLLLTVERVLSTWAWNPPPLRAELFSMVLLMMVGLLGPKARMPPPYPSVWFSRMMLPRMVGEPRIKMPPPPSDGRPVPPVMVKPSTTVSGPTRAEISTVGPPLLPSMMVDMGPFTLVRVMALPSRLMFSTYVPSATRTVVPVPAAAMAA